MAQFFKVQKCVCKMGHVSPTPPPLRVTCYPYTWTCYNQCLCQIWSSFLTSPVTATWKAMPNVQNTKNCTWKGLQQANDLQGHSMSSLLDRSYITSYQWSVVTTFLSCTVSEILSTNCQNLKRSCDCDWVWPHPLKDWPTSIQSLA